MSKEIKIKIHPPWRKTPDRLTPKETIKRYGCFLNSILITQRNEWMRPLRDAGREKLIKVIKSGS